ncbi:NADH-quinone oxidoreductase subunit NuoF [Serpentinicella alkaliphila]|uniref:NADH-quinone oxidoreductase subunit F n=1 Tax=Serpentinicella alkaliphila TaxID=1734049 RepID=A0A4R2TYK5_9FIRM|nr:NADH-quinone oxidoreductase subunit NuoF [Serpentinicella alkaliphila]QUH25681.1 NADH-quinone oxidoreductase subunit NuoF [Serpentinicella alkaliphila]TCQ06605.1 NADH-quinone oxidoreductase subunit F [Serpentinicella alkaliphila]
MKIVVGLGSCGIAAGAQKVYDEIKNQLKARGVDNKIEPVGCNGMCYLEPIVEFIHEDGKKHTYTKVTTSAIEEILDGIFQGQPCEKHLIDAKQGDKLYKQNRIALKNCGVINPENINEYIENKGYEAIKKCVKELTPIQVIEEIKTSNIRGRGGAGFPTWFKWNVAMKNKEDQKYIICNADEGDPGAFMDRSILEGDPHAVIEGMMIAGYAIGAQEGVIYVRAEYPLAIVRLQKAIDQARELNLLGVNIFNSSFKFDLKIKAGAGAFVCGEETALIASVEGERGMPRIKPPFPAEKGLWQKPTNINNVETLANIPWIINEGGKAFADIGMANSQGTKVFALTGKIKDGGLVEVPMGTSIREVIYDIGGGIRDDKECKAVQLGGPSGGCVPKELLDTLVDYEAITKTGAIMGSGGMVVMDDTTCMVDMAKFFLDFTCKESCGKCIHCRLGTKRMLEILDRITDGKGQPGDIELLEDLGNGIKEGSLCGLGQTAPNPVLSTIKYFRNEYEKHIVDKTCPAKQCKALLTYEVIQEKCIKCGLCFRNCSVKAIARDENKTYTVQHEDCIKCGVCVDVCPVGAVSVN